ncbi:DUF3795 domain-containing protein [candidate division KSB1 bacterium]|nr:DUF3795 domain-containing protein [candidate division KSB1 bacterium]
MSDLRLVTYCGLYCGLCAQKCRIPHRALALKEAMQKEGYEHWGQAIPGFKDFWKFLGGLVTSENACSCRESSCGPPFCAIRNCAREKNIDICASCEDYPCEKIEGIAKGYPTLLADGNRIMAIGIESWIKEQEDCAKTGFAYVDIRCYPYHVPD